MQHFLDQHLLLPNYDKLQEAIEAEDGRTKFNFGDLLCGDSVEEWWRFKRNRIEQKIDTYCNFENIDLDTVTLWTDKKMTTMSFDLADSKKDVPVKRSKPWWKFW